MKIKPCGDRLYVRLGKVESGMSEGGIYLPDLHSEESRLGEVVDIGPDVNPKPYKERVLVEVNGKVEEKIATIVPEPLFEIGDRVIIQFFSGTAIHIVSENILDDTHRIVGFREVLAKV
jgi:co-chaperonin GroES (HSP10)